MITQDCLIREIVKEHHGFKLGFSRHYLTLYSIVLGLETKRAFEFGCGFSTKVILAALENTDGKLVSIDKRNYETCKIGDVDKTRWRFIQSDSNDSPLMYAGLDFVLHDGAHDEETVCNDISRILPNMKIDSILLVHDTVYKYKDIMKGVKEALSSIKHQRIELPYCCGLSIIRVQEDFGQGRVKTTWSKQK